MKPCVKAPFAVYGEEEAKELIAPVRGRVTRFKGITVPLDIFLNDVWQSAKREGFIEGYVRERSQLYADLYGHEPPASVMGEWRKQAGKKAFCGEDEDSS